MKKLFGIILILVFVISLGSTSLAATNGADVPDQNVPGAPAINVVDDTYDQPEREITDGELPAGTNKGSAKTADIQDQEIPKALPKTGGVPAETFYVAGGVLVAAALFLSMKKTAKG
ncbi:MAG TPA: LPXTG cell wall anchor domain-containing protein [Clostridia bacterium]|nr:LPXTG cell wall anchor domain-containing protein [Clostridia bacterium]